MGVFFSLSNSSGILSNKGERMFKVERKAVFFLYCFSNFEASVLSGGSKKKKKKHLLGVFIL